MKETFPDISFIIPVYNGASVIGRMLDSIALLPDAIAYETIVVNDGSGDRTARILEEGKAQWEHLKVITTENKGQSHARNTGLQEAAGKYIFFADADDRIIPEGIEALLKEAEKVSCDVISGTYLRIEPGKEPYQACRELESGRLTREGEEQALFHAFKAQSAFGYIWNKLFRREFLLANRISFDDTIKVYMEDQLFNLKAFGIGAAYYFYNVPVYEYFYEGTSTTRKPEPDIAEKSTAMLRSYDRFLEENRIREENQDLFVPLAMRMACWAAFKNIPYEGAVYAKIKKRLSLFAEEEALSYMFRRPESRQYLKELPSFLQRAFFRLSFSLLKRKRTGLLAFLFVIGSPVLKKAASVMVR